MIERKIIEDNFLEFAVSSFIRETLGDVPIKDVSVEKNPIGERIVIYTSTPGLVIGREGSNIKKLTETLRARFNFENPQIKIGEVKDMFLSANIVAKRIANDLSNFGLQKFKLTAFKTIANVMNSGAMGVEIKLSGKIPSARAKSWRFAEGYLKKTGYVSDFLIDHSIEKVTLKTGVVGVQVSIMLPDTPLPDKIEYLGDVVSQKVVEEIVENVDSTSISLKEEVVAEVKEKAEENGEEDVKKIVKKSTPKTESKTKSNKEEPLKEEKKIIKKSKDSTETESKKVTKNAKVDKEEKTSKKVKEVKSK